MQVAALRFGTSYFQKYYLVRHRLWLLSLPQHYTYGFDFVSSFNTVRFFGSVFGAVGVLGGVLGCATGTFSFVLPVLRLSGVSTVSGRSLRAHCPRYHQLQSLLSLSIALSKQRTSRLVVRWVTTSEYPLLYVFDFVAHAEGMCQWTYKVARARQHISISVKTFRKS